MRAVKKVMYRVHVLHNLVTTGMSKVALRMMASCMHYDLSLDGSEVVAYVAMKDERDLQSRCLEERIQVFSLYGSTGCLPSYQRLMSRENTSIKESIKE